MPNSSPTLQLWFARVGDNTKQIEHETTSLLSVSEKYRFEKTKSPNKKREYLLSRALMRQALSQELKIPISELCFIEQKNFTPHISNSKEKIFFSLSHSNGNICFIISPVAVGIDIESTEKNKDFLALSDLFMSEEEAKLAIQMDKNKEPLREYFYRIWCAKEAFYKVMSSSHYAADITPIKNMSILSYLEKEDNEWSLNEYFFNNLQLSLVIKQKQVSINIHQFHTDIIASSL